MLDVQPSISGVLLPVMPLLDTSATPNSNSCHRDSTALRRQRADWRGIEKKGGAMEGLLGAGGQQQFTGKQVIFYAPLPLCSQMLWKQSSECNAERQVIQISSMGRLQQLTPSKD